MDNFHFKLMSLAFIFRDFFSPRSNVLSEVGITEGNHILDYGCGTGSYSIIAARLVGTAGRVYALDIHPLAIDKVRSTASKKNLTNIETILSDCATRLEDGSIDIVLLYDTFHSLTDPDSVLRELYRVLKPNGILSFSDHHMNEHEIIDRVTKVKLFELSRKGKKTHSFIKK